MSISWKRRCFSPHQSKPGEPLRNDQSSVGPPRVPPASRPSAGCPAVQRGSRLSSHGWMEDEDLKRERNRKRGGGDVLLRHQHGSETHEKLLQRSEAVPPAPLQRQPLLERKPGRALKIQHRRSRGGGGGGGWRTRSICLVVNMTERSANRNHERNRDANARFCRFTPQVPPPPPPSC